MSVLSDYERRLQKVWVQCAAAEVQGMTTGDAAHSADLMVEEFKKRWPAPKEEPVIPTNYLPLAWGAKVSPEFRKAAAEVSQRLAINPSWLMSIMAFESGYTFSPSILNKAGSGAVGLIQFMPQTLTALGWTVEHVSKLSAVEQLQVVEKYFHQFSSDFKSIEDLYMAVLWPGAISKPITYVLFDKSDPAHPAQYIQNAGLDWNKDGKITKGEAAKFVTDALTRGLAEGNVYVGPF